MYLASIESQRTKMYRYVLVIHLVTMYHEFGENQKLLMYHRQEDKPKDTNAPMNNSSP